MKGPLRGNVEGRVFMGLCLTHIVVSLHPPELHSTDVCEVACYQIAACCSIHQDQHSNLTRINNSPASEIFTMSGKWSEIMQNSCATFSLVLDKASQIFRCAKSSEHARPGHAAGMSRVLIAPVLDGNSTDGNLYQLHLNDFTTTKDLGFSIAVRDMVYVSSLRMLLISTDTELLSRLIDEYTIMLHLHLPGIRSMALDQDQQLLFIMRQQNANYSVARVSVEGKQVKSILEGYKMTSLVINSSQRRFFFTVGPMIKSSDYEGRNLQTVLKYIGQIHGITFDRAEESLYYYVTYPFLTHISLYKLSLVSNKKTKIMILVSPMTSLLFYEEARAVYTLSGKGDIYLIDFKAVPKVSEVKVRIFDESVSVIMCLVH
ncbi:uncharacterized protein [Haliotis cracherodii]|uniref:uncharacterized protein n=1 Tax=Haliotis cracherodii TaxID=6455 RepID=UPI0039ED26BD